MFAGRELDLLRRQAADDAEPRRPTRTARSCATPACGRWPRRVVARGHACARLREDGDGEDADGASGALDAHLARAKRAVCWRSAGGAEAAVADPEDEVGAAPASARPPGVEVVRDRRVAADAGAGRGALPRAGRRSTQCGPDDGEVLRLVRRPAGRRRPRPLPRAPRPRPRAIRGARCRYRGADRTTPARERTAAGIEHPRVDRRDHRRRQRARGDHQRREGTQRRARRGAGPSARKAGPSSAARRRGSRGRAGRGRPPGARSRPEEAPDGVPSRSPRVARGERGENRDERREVSELATEQGTDVAQRDPRVDLGVDEAMRSIGQPVRASKATTGRRRRLPRRGRPRGRGCAGARAPGARRTRWRAPEEGEPGHLRRSRRPPRGARPRRRPRRLARSRRESAARGARGQGAVQAERAAGDRASSRRDRRPSRARAPATSGRRRGRDASRAGTRGRRARASTGKAVARSAVTRCARSGEGASRRR